MVLDPHLDDWLDGRPPHHGHRGGHGPDSRHHVEWKDEHMFAGFAGSSSSSWSSSSSDSSSDSSSWDDSSSSEFEGRRHNDKRHSSGIMTMIEDFWGSSRSGSS